MPISLTVSGMLTETRSLHSLKVYGSIFTIPGGIMTEMLKSVYAATPALWDRVKETCPLPPHVSDPIDIAYGALFLASDESRSMTGSELVMDCGYMAH